MPEEVRSQPIALAELLDAFEFVSASELDEHRAYFCKATGRFIFVSESIDLEDGQEPPGNLEQGEYVAVPHRTDLDLGSRVAFSFVAEELPDSTEEVRRIFSRKGAYRRFKHFLHTSGALERWYLFEERAKLEALRNWCNEAGVTLDEDEPQG